ncbi:hypothetical protein L3X38_021814 [Prunus dulcis]|uniref:Uncharacterized protein n=1 Tax=Prunus dulcis TaxID=3755 RepID=A0AAD4Z4K7_PRUDU|nr:hypothetical protein L3X38_021814 [Prunus dulcis]
MYAAEPKGFDFDHLSLLPLVVKSAHILCKIKICLVTLADFSEEDQEAWTFGLVFLPNLCVAFKGLLSGFIRG